MQINDTIFHQGKQKSISNTLRIVSGVREVQSTSSICSSNTKNDFHSFNKLT